jgi:hypothetical protein
VVKQLIGNVSVLAGWSRGRVGVIFLLATAGQAKVNAAHRIVLIDPGNTAEFTGGCDHNYNVNSLLATWLARSGNELLILTGQSTEEKPYVHGHLGSSTFKGLWKYYLAGIWNKPFANRALICDYALADHQQIMKDAWALCSSRRTAALSSVMRHCQ